MGPSVWCQEPACLLNSIGVCLQAALVDLYHGQPSIRDGCTEVPLHLLLVLRCLPPFLTRLQLWSLWKCRAEDRTSSYLHDPCCACFSLQSKTWSLLSAKKITRSRKVIGEEAERQLSFGASSYPCHQALLLDGWWSKRKALLAEQGHVFHPALYQLSLFRR